MQPPNTTLQTHHIHYPKLLAAILVAWYLFSCANNTNFGHFIDNIDLIIHEAGHPIFSFFGDLVMFLGGSFNQILIPFIFSVYFFFRKEYYSASIVGMWVGYNIVNVSYYMADAILMNIPLLGGDSSSHDWNNIFSMTHTLSYTHTFSSIAWTIGMAVMIIGLCFAIWYSIRPQPETQFE
jgi:hypothetical protein